MVDAIAAGNVDAALHAVREHAQEIAPAAPPPSATGETRRSSRASGRKQG